MSDSPKHGVFSIAEACSNAAGKTSMGLICGGILVITGCIGFISSLWAKTIDWGYLALAFVTAGVGLITVRRFTKDKQLTNLTDGKTTDNQGADSGAGQ